MRLLALFFVASATAQLVMTINGENPLTVVQSTGNYMDAGAECYYNGQDISYNVQVSGQVVFLNNVGTYSINYSCRDDDDPTTITKTRVVNVVSNIVD